MSKIEPAQIARALGQHVPTDDQAKVIAGEAEPTLVVAGAGAGKTETMASRVVWLVANEIVLPSQVLGLTFTRKAASQLARRIRQRLDEFSRTPLARGTGGSEQLATLIRTSEPQISTYDSYAGAIVKAYGLLVPAEPDAGLLSETAMFQLAHDIVSRWESPLRVEVGVPELVSRVLKLYGQLGEHLVSTDDLRADAGSLEEHFESIPKGPRQRSERTREMGKWLDKQLDRLELADMVDALDERLQHEGALTFGRQMSLAAELGAEHAVVGDTERESFRAVLLDEYQDTGHAQRLMLSGIFGRGGDPVPAVTAVGDPMQCIYGWRGASDSNLPQFVTDFPRSDGTPAEVFSLATSWRNPPEILALANSVTAPLAARPGSVGVAELSARPGSDPGDVHLALFDTIDEEREWVADSIASAYRERLEATGEPPTAAVLVRQNKHAQPFADALHERGIPAEISGVAGLLGVPEIQDVVALLTVVARPGSSSAALRLLTGPRFGIGPADLERLRDRTGELSLRTGTRAETGVITDVADVEAAIEELRATETGDAAGLVDALADPGPTERYTPAGGRRIVELAGVIDRLREHSTATPARLVAAAARELGLEVELRVRYLTGAGDGPQHLDRFRQVAASYAQGVSASLSGFLDYLDVAATEENGLELGEAAAQPGRVQILTVHRAKGLEWEIVAVPHASEGIFPGERKKESWLGTAAVVPSQLRGDRESEENPTGVPVLEFEACEDRKELEDACAAHGAAHADRRLDEDRRLFYVALTRSEKTLLVSGFHWGENKTVRGPSEFLAEIKQVCDEAETDIADVVEWVEEPSAENPVATGGVTATWPRPAPEPGAVGGGRNAARAAVGDARPVRLDDEEPVADGLGAQARSWRADAATLLAERRALQSGPVASELPARLSASEIVAYSADPERFRARLRRPLPFKPNRHARRGTRFHAWLEHRFGATSLLDLDDLPGAGDDAAADADLDELRAAFEASAWADRTPLQVEVPFDVGIGRHLVRGRMDAVFEEPGGWIVVDWKTGAIPADAALPDIALQLAVYRHAWIRILESERGERIDPGRVRAAFHYVRHDKTIEFPELPGPDEIEKLLDSGDALLSPGPRW